MRRPRLRLSRFARAGSWAWHAATAVTAASAFMAWQAIFGSVPPDRFTAAVSFCTTVVAVSGWKAERRRTFRARHERDHALSNAAWLTSQLSSRTAELVAAQRQPPPPLVTLTVQGPRYLGPPEPPPEADWPTVPLLFHAEHPHDPAARVYAVKLPPGAPWHTES